MIKDLEKIFKSSHSNIKANFSNLERSKYAVRSDDKWKRSEGGGGNTFVIQGGKFFDNCEKSFQKQP